MKYGIHLTKRKWEVMVWAILIQRGVRTSEVYCAGDYHPESIDTIWDDHKMDKWTKSRAIYRAITKTGHKNRK